MNSQVRIYRENPIAWWDKPVMRFLRHKYGKDKKKFVLIRSIYLALCEIESDFVDTAINSFTKTVGTYAGVSREVAGRYINLLIQEGLITKTRIKDPKTKKYLTGTIIQILNGKSHTATSEPLSGYPSNGVLQHRDTRAGIRNVSINKKLSISKNNVFDKNETKKTQDEINYYAELIADRLEDRKSINFYKQVCHRHSPQKLLQKAQEIKTDGGARNAGAVFVSWLQKQNKIQY